MVSEARKQSTIEKYMAKTKAVFFGGRVTGKKGHNLKKVPWFITSVKVSSLDRRLISIEDRNPTTSIAK
jgi:hypothetical protein